MSDKTKEAVALAFAALVGWFAFSVLPGPALEPSEWAAWVQAFGVVVALAISIRQGAEARTRERERDYASAHAVQSLAANVHQALISFHSMVADSQQPGATRGPLAVASSLLERRRLADLETAAFGFDVSRVPSGRLVETLMVVQRSLREFHQWLEGVASPNQALLLVDPWRVLDSLNRAHLVAMEEVHRLSAPLTRARR